MREFRIKVNNEKTYVVKANDYNQAVKTLHSKLRDNAVSDSISKYNGEDAIKTNGFVKIKEDGDWTSYKYNGSDFDGAVFKIHQYNPSLIAFVSNGNRTITVRNKYLKDFSIKDVSYVSGKKLKIGQKIVEDGEVLEVVDIKETQRGVNNNYRDVTLKNVKTGATETVHFVNSALARLNDYSPKYNKGQKIQTSAGIHEIIGYDPVRSDVHTNRIEYSYRLKTPNGTYTNMPDWQLEKLVELGRYKLIDSDIKDSDSYQVWTINEKGVYHKEADVPNPQLAKAIASQLKKQGRWVQISKNSRTNIVSDCNMMDSLTIKVKLNGKTYEGVFNGISNADKTFGDVYIPELVSLHSGDKGVFNPDEGNYVSDGKFYFKMENLKKWNPFLNNYLTDSDSNKKQQLKAELDKLDKEWDRLDNLGRPTEHITAEMEAIREELKKLEDCSTVMTKDADPVKVEKIIRKEKSALGITYYLFQTKSNSGATIYFEVTDKTYHGEPTYSGGGIVSFSLKTANDSLDSHLLSDKLKAKYGEKEGTNRFLRGENDSAIKDKLSTSDANSFVEAYIDKYKYTHSNLPYVNKPKIKIFKSPEEFRDKFLSSHRGYSIYAGGLLNYNGYVVKLFTSAKDGKIESPSADNIFTIFPTTAIKDSANITELTKKAKQLKNKLKKEKAHSYENWGQAEIRQLKDLFDYNNYSQSTKIINEFINWVDERTPGKIGDSNPNNIKNRKSYTIKVGDKQYKVFAESESEAIDKYIKSKK